MNKQTIAIALSVFASAVFLSGNAFADQPTHKTCPVIKGTKAVLHGGKVAVKRTSKAIFFVGHRAVNMTSGATYMVGNTAFGIVGFVPRTAAGALRILAPKVMEKPANGLEKLGNGINEVGDDITIFASGAISTVGNGVLDVTETGLNKVGGVIPIK